ncbi:MAG: hypothetical protein FVQ79_03430 [Planctomycetes bacterium]|nr:hypothetical protein [Planctomycetota bacterium]
MKDPSEKAKDAVHNLLENRGITKGEALEKANYSDSIIKNPHQVFNNPVVQEYVLKLMKEMGLHPKKAIGKLKRRMNSRRLDHMTFPPFREKRKEEENTGEHRGEQLTDDDIRLMLTEVNCVVRRIVHGDMARHVYFWTENDKAQLIALEQVWKLLGMYAPTRVEGRHSVKVSFFSDLRRRTKDDGLPILVQEPGKDG